MTTLRNDTKTDRPLLSICIPTYNRADYLRDCLRSIIDGLNEDTSPLVEIHVSDNASTDDTEAVVKEFRAEKPEIYYFRNSENLGCERNLVGAANMAAGEYTWIFGDDDLVEDGAFLKILPFLADGRYDFFLLNKIVKNKDLSEVIYERQNHHRGNIAFESLVDLTMVFGYFTQLGFLTSAIFRTESFKRVDPEPYIALNSFYPQNGIWLEAFHDKPCLFIHNVLITHRQFNQHMDSINTGQAHCCVMPMIEMMMLLEKKGILTVRLIEEIVERPLKGGFYSLANDVVRNLATWYKYGHQFSVEDWRKIITAFSSFSTHSYLVSILEAYIQSINVLINENRIDQALEHAFSLNSKVLNFYAGHEIVGQIMMRKGAFQEAANAFGQAAKLAPQRADVYQQWGEALIAAGRMEDAAGVLQQCLQIDQSRVDAAILYAEALCATGRAQQGLPIFRHLAATNPGRADIATKAGMALIQAEILAEAEQVLGRAHQLDPKTRGLNLALGILHWQKADRRNAIDLVRRELDLYPATPAAARHLADMYKMDNRMDEGMAVLRQYLDRGAAQASPFQVG